MVLYGNRRVRDDPETFFFKVKIIIRGIDYVYAILYICMHIRMNNYYRARLFVARQNAF